MSRKNFIQVSNKRVSQKYDMGDILGEGAFGIVRRAIHKRSGLERAVKSILKVKLGDDKFREFNYLRDLDHPHII